ncbi:MAG: DUF4395 domain-containing protein [Propionicimonas sp.]|uniref:DUF4395 domain-containing protein n=1 Tax=Propionicimonas sp. TaxID=1955623 RepID=UPI002B1F0443|nr:DUF4395 domain-containing protein [Propionicimonas sp.]MEA4945176.1 DUF4395 domain-containing protein [Propionicimonas sp.]MEA5116870.1 DUF4395 domain-containing protein [Propionicimonas sp.]
MPTSPSPSPAATGIDPRGPRFGAAITVVLLVAALILGPTPAGLAVLAVQLLAFAAGALLGLAYQPWGVLYRRLVRPRLQPPTELEEEAPPRFAQLVGLIFAAVGFVGGLLTAPVVFYVALGFALIAAFLNAVFDFCLGCELYLLGRRLRARFQPTTT